MAEKNAVSLGVSVLIIVVLILIVGFGMYLDITFNTTGTTSIAATTSSSHIASTTFQTTTETMSSVSNSTRVLVCASTDYTVWSVEVISNSTTRGATSTQSWQTSYTTTSDVAQSMGYATTTIEYTGTLTGPLAEWQVQACTYVK